MDTRIEHFRNLHQNIWFHIMNDVLHELVTPKNLVSTFIQDEYRRKYKIAWNAWSPMYSNDLKSEAWVEELYDP
jgi:hypothetical protein